MLKLDDKKYLLHLIAKGMGEKLRSRRGRNVLWCVEDGGCCGVCSSDAHNSVQKPVSAAQMQLTYATRSPQARQIAARVICGSQADITTGISTRDSAATERSFFKLVFEGLCGATMTLVERLDCRTPHYSWYTFAS